MSTKVICDRCGEVAAESGRSRRDHLTLNTIDGKAERHLDLCKACAQSLKNWMKPTSVHDEKRARQ